MRKSTVMLLIAAMLMLGAAIAQADPTPAPEEDQQTPAPKLAKNIDEMKALHQKIGMEPQGATKCFLDAVFVYMNPLTRNEGRKMLQYLAIPLMENQEWDKHTERLFVERMVNESYHHIWRSYAKGTSPENGYAMDPNNWVLNFERTHRFENDPRGLQVYLRSSGADNPRVVYVKQSTASGLWYMNIWPSLYVGIRPPVDPTKEQFN